jgi:hypothetical protein
MTAAHSEAGCPIFRKVGSFRQNYKDGRGERI